MFENNLSNEQENEKEQEKENEQELTKSSLENNKWTVWKVEYKRHTNFAMEYTITDLDGNTITDLEYIELEKKLN
jgi:4-aminobutyrate aminotransferase-like enzyme